MPWWKVVSVWGAIGCVWVLLSTAHAQGPLLKGVAISPPGFPATYDYIPEFLDKITTWTNNTLMWNGAWRDDPDGADSGVIPEAPGAVWSNQAEFGYVPVPVFGWRDDSAPTNLHLRVPGNNTNNWTNLDAQALFLSMLTNFAAQMDSPYIFIGNENDFYYRYDSEDYTNWVAFYHAAYDAIKAVDPTTLVGSIFNYEHMAGRGTLNAWTNSYWEALDLYDLDRLDLIGITTYPFFEYATPDLMPHTHYDELFDRIGDKRIAFTEIGWPAIDYFEGALPWEASPAAQAEFLTYFSLAMFDKPVEFVQWPFLHHLSEPTESNDFWRVLSSVALYDLEQNQMPAYDLFLSLPVLTLDRDEDGIPDWWEIVHFGGPTNAVASADDDQDGFTNLEEYIADTDPHADTSFPAIQMTINDSTIDLIADVSTNRLYTFESNTNLVDGAWTTLFKVHPSSSSLHVTVTNNRSWLSYRFRVELP